MNIGFVPEQSAGCSLEDLDVIFESESSLSAALHFDDVFHAVDVIKGMKVRKKLDIMAYMCYSIYQNSVSRWLLTIADCHRCQSRGSRNVKARNSNRKRISLQESR